MNFDKLNIPNERVRAYIYRVAVAVGVLLTAYGVVGDAEVTPIIEVIGAVLMVGPAGLASRNTSAKKPVVDNTESV